MELKTKENNLFDNLFTYVRSKSNNVQIVEEKTLKGAKINQDKCVFYITSRNNRIVIHFPTSKKPYPFIEANVEKMKLEIDNIFTNYDIYCQNMPKNIVLPKKRAHKSNPNVIIHEIKDSEIKQSIKMTPKEKSVQRVNSLKKAKEINFTDMRITCSEKEMKLILNYLNNKKVNYKITLQVVDGEVKKY